ncbi:asparagine synthase-related protein [Paenibacillus sp. GCM10023250]|uniref:asparagine synthase-related protein n=1 Tax=Paenibacillus sp. GCM10023250 TaxID=3252648 RepID=UPI00360DFBE2
MSLIVGIVYKEGQSHDALREEGQRLMHAMRLYPADDRQHWQEDSVFMGCHAKWITPQAVSEKLPYYDEIYDIAITADVILDNREDLYRLLQVIPSQRDVITDSELIVLAYVRWGTESPKHLIGDYAFMIWDKKNKLLFGARDLAGNRTLYYHQHRQKITFCTAITPLFSLDYIEKALNEYWFSEYLAISAPIDCVDPFMTAYRNIQQIPPGHCLIATKGTLHVVRYDTLVTDEQVLLQSNSDYEEAFREVFSQAVSSRLRTFKQIGATLSGGLDSGSVASFAARSLRDEGRTLYAYSHVPAADFKDWTASHMMANERPLIQETVRHIGNIKATYLDSPGLSPLTEIDEVLRIMESPYKFFINSFWIKDIYEKASQQDIGVLLTGARGNNSISWGSVTQYCAHLLKSMQWVRFYQHATLFSQQIKVRRSRLFPNIAKLAFPLMARLPFVKTNREGEIPSLIHPDFASRTEVYNKLKEHEYTISDAPLNLMQERQFFFNNLAVLNMQGTSGSKLSLRYGVWERDPSCDPRVVRFCLSIPVEQFVLQGVGRSLIRRATKGYLPDSVRMNQRLRGVQGADWVHRMIPSWPEFIAEMRILCRDPQVMEYMNVVAINAALSDIERKLPQPDLATNDNMIFLMRSLIVYRFLKSF